MADPAIPPAATPPATPPAAGDPPSATPPATPPAGTRSAAEIELELVKAQLASKQKDSDLHKQKEENRKKDEQLAAARHALRAAGVIENDGDDPKAVVEKHQKEQRSKELRQNAIERAALKKLIPTGLGEADADLILGSVLRAPGVSFDEATGVVSGLDEAFAVLKPTIERLSGKPAAAPGATPPVPAPPVPPPPGAGGTPMEAEFQGVKTAKDFMTLPASVQERFETKHPELARRFEAEFMASTQRGRPPTYAPAASAR